MTARERFLTRTTCAALATLVVLVTVASDASAQSAAHTRLQGLQCPPEARERIAELLTPYEGDEGPPSSVLDRGDWIVISRSSFGGGIHESSNRESLLVRTSDCFTASVEDWWPNSQPCVSNFTLSDGETPAPLQWVQLIVGGEVESFDPARHGLAQVWFETRSAPFEGRDSPLALERQEQRSAEGGPEPEVSAHPLAGRVQPWREGRPRTRGAVYDPATGRFLALEARARRVRVGRYTLIEVRPRSRFNATAIAIVEGRRRHRWLGVTLENTGAVGRPRWIGARQGWIFGLVDDGYGEFPRALLALRPADGAARVLQLHFEGEEELSYVESARVSARMLRAQVCPYCQRVSYRLDTVLEALNQSAQAPAATPEPGANVALPGDSTTAATNENEGNADVSCR